MGSLTPAVQGTLLRRLLHLLHANWVAALSLALLLPFIVVPVADLYPHGRILRWHILQSSYQASIVQFALLFAAVWYGLRRDTFRSALFFVGLTAFFYLRYQHVDVPALMGALYLEMILALGAVVMRLGAKSGTTDRTESWAGAFVCGLAAWVCVLLFASVLGYGRPQDLRIMTGIAVVPIFFVARRPPWTLLLLRKGWQLPRAERIWIAAFIAWVLVLLARTNSITGYDPLWYGFRAQYVLAPDRSLFDVTGLVSPVFYFPKLFELALMPLSAFSDFSFPMALNIGLLVLTAHLVSRLCRLWGGSGNLALAAAAIVFSIPAIANSALTPKPDLIAGLLFLLAFWFTVLALKQRDLNNLLFAFGAGALSIQCKLVSVPYLGVLAVAVCLAAHVWRVRADWPTPQRWAPATRIAWVCALLCLVVTVALTFRTWHLTGMPTVGPDPLVKIWNLLGFEFKEPTGTLQWTWPQVWSEVPMIAFDMLFKPSRLPNIIITWIGNIWLWIALFAALCAISRPKLASYKDGHWLLGLCVMGCGLVLAFSVRLHSRGGDGNYLIAPLLIAVPLFLATLSRLTETEVRRSERVVATLGVVCAVVFHCSYSLANAWWSAPGTRAWDWNFAGGVYDTKDMRSDKLKFYGLSEAEEVLLKERHPLHVVGYTKEDSGFWLSARYESLHSIMFSRPEYVSTRDGFLRFSKLANVDMVILPAVQEDKAPDDPSVVDAMLRPRCAQALPSCQKVGRYLLIDLR